MSESNSQPSKAFKAGFVALVGEPNAGKSTLLNTILDEKVSIVSAKPQTTRARVTGIYNSDEAQIVFVDAPGSLRSTSGINKFLQEEIKDVIENADVVCALLSADASLESVESLVKTIRAEKKPWVAIITKIDLMGGGTRTPKFFQYLIEEGIPFVSISSAKRPGEAKAEVLARVLPLLPASDGPLYDTELYTTQTLRQMAAEAIREAAFENLHQEIPYGLAVLIRSFKEDEPVLRIQAELVLDKDNHKAIVIGAKGSMLKTIGTQARKAIEKFTGEKVFLELHVSVKRNWTQNPRMLKELGYVVPEER
jgi:GTP-binding protein Era